jgi:hypothetical protein
LRVTVRDVGIVAHHEDTDEQGGHARRQGGPGHGAGCEHRRADDDAGTDQERVQEPRELDVDREDEGDGEQEQRQSIGPRQPQVREGGEDRQQRCHLPIHVEAQDLSDAHRVEAHEQRKHDRLSVRQARDMTERGNGQPE